MERSLNFSIAAWKKLLTTLFSIKNRDEIISQINFLIFIAAGCVSV